MGAPVRPNMLNMPKSASVAATIASCKHRVRRGLGGRRCKFRNGRPIIHCSALLVYAGYRVRLLSMQWRSQNFTV